MSNTSSFSAAPNTSKPPYPGKTNQDVINAFTQVDPTFALLLACYGPWETNGLAIPSRNRDLPYAGPPVLALLTPANADRVHEEDLERVEAALGGAHVEEAPEAPLTGIGVWSYSESDDRGTVKARVQQAIDATIRLKGNTVLWKVGDMSHLYPFFDLARQIIHDAGLNPMAWLVNRLVSPAQETDIVRTAFRSGYTGMVFDYEAPQCFHRQAGAAQLASNLSALAQQGEFDLHDLYLCCFPNLTAKINDGLPVKELHAVCEGGMMPMTYGEFFFANSSLRPEQQARRVFTEWAAGQYADFLRDSGAPERPQYRILGLYHQQSSNDSTILPMKAAEAQVWLDQLAEFQQPFWSWWEPALLTAELAFLLRNFAPLHSMSHA